MQEPYAASADVTVLPSPLPIPGAGFLTINAFVLKSSDPVLFDTALSIDSDDFIAGVESVVPLNELKWIWLTHDDADHTGNIAQLMDLAPNATLITHAFCAFRMTWWPVPMHRVRALTFGDRIDVGDRKLRALQPPTFDNPMSIGAFDESTGSLFSADAFGAILPEIAQNAWDIPQDALAGGMVAWGTMDSPWTHVIETKRFDVVLDSVRQLGAQQIFSSHLPAADKGIDKLVDVLRSLPDVEPPAPPSHEMFEQMLAAMAH